MDETTNIAFGIVDNNVEKRFEALNHAIHDALHAEFKLGVRADSESEADYMSAQDESNFKSRLMWNRFYEVAAAANLAIRGTEPSFSWDGKFSDAEIQEWN